MRLQLEAHLLNLLKKGFGRFQGRPETVRRQIPICIAGPVPPRFVGTNLLRPQQVPPVKYLPGPISDE